AAAAQLQAEQEDLALRLFYLREAGTNVRSDLTLLQNTTRKARSEKTQAEEHKHKQDLLVERLTVRAERLAEQISVYQVQAAAQAQETRAARDTLSEAQMEIEALAMERKQLLQQWDSSLIGMRRRDEAHTALLQALQLSRQQLSSLDSELEGYRKSITREQERNERLSEQLSRAQQGSTTVRRQIAQSRTQQEALRAQYSTYTRTLEETQQALDRARVECATRRGELNVLRKHIEKEAAIRLGLEESIMGKMQEKLSNNKAAKYSWHLAGKLADQKRERVRVGLWREGWRARGPSLSLALILSLYLSLSPSVSLSLTLRHEQLSHSEAEITRRVTLIKRKQSIINLHNKRVEEIAASTGHEDLGPQEIEARALSRQLEETDSEVAKLQQDWLRQQGELVRLSRERQAQSLALQTQRQELTVLQQRKVRTEGEIQRELREQGEVERHMKSLMADMLKLNSLLCQKSGRREELQQGNSLMETEFLHRLKEAELEALQTQVQLERIQEEKDRLTNSLVEAERQIMLWEKKTQLARETRTAVDSEVGQGDIRTMRAEIHRMEVRYGQLMKQQEKLVRGMEAAVSQRESIALRGETQSRGDRKQPTRTELHYTLLSLRRKIQDTQQLAAQCDSVLQELQDSHSVLSSELQDKQQQLEELQGGSQVLTSDLQGLQDNKDRNLSRIVGLQTRARLLQAVREGRYSVQAKSAETLEGEMQRQSDRLHATATILHRLCQEFPQHQGALRRVSLALSAKLQQPDQDSA
ncbi:CCD40 protein, partial [Amia calva]|nr:CCD40 protein [Amia calva]